MATTDTDLVGNYPHGLADCSVAICHAHATIQRLGGGANTFEPSRRENSEQRRIVAEDSVAAASRTADGESSTSATPVTVKRNVLSVLSFLSALAAFSCALASLVATAWVDTREPIYLPDREHWPMLFGSGYGSLSHAESKLRNVYKSQVATPLGFVEDFANGPMLATSPPTDSGLFVMGRADGATESPTTLAAENTTEPPEHVEGVGNMGAKDADDDEEDLFDYDYYAMDEAVGRRRLPAAAVDVVAAARLPGGGDVDDEEEETDERRSGEHANRLFIDDRQQADEADDGEEHSRKFLVVVFHVGLWRACPYLFRGQLDPNIG